MRKIFQFALALVLSVLFTSHGFAQTQNMADLKATIAENVKNEEQSRTSASKAGYKIQLVQNYMAALQRFYFVTDAATSSRMQEKYATAIAAITNALGNVNVQIVEAYNVTAEGWRVIDEKKLSLDEFMAAVPAVFRVGNDVFVREDFFADERLSGREIGTMALVTTMLGGAQVMAERDQLDAMLRAGQIDARVVIQFRHWQDGVARDLAMNASGPISKSDQQKAWKVLQVTKWVSAQTPMLAEDVAFAFPGSDR